MALKRALASPLLLINFGLYAASACLAGWALNRIIDAQNIQGADAVGNRVTPFFLTAALVACMVGLASGFAGIHHLRVRRGDSLAAGAATSLIAWLLNLLAMGLAAKEIHVGGGYRPRILKVLEAFITVLSHFELLYLLSLHAGFLGGTTGTGHGTGIGYGTGTGGHDSGSGFGTSSGQGSSTGFGASTGNDSGTTGIGMGAIGAKKLSKPKNSGHLTDVHGDTGIGMGAIGATKLSKPKSSGRLMDVIEQQHGDHVDYGVHTDLKIPVGHVGHKKSTLL